MRDVLTAGRAVLRVVALAWLLVAAPLELATSLAGLVSRSPVHLGLPAHGLIASRVLVVALGLVLGRQIARRATGLRPFARRWAVADLGTLAIALASDAVPSSRAPGDALLVWGTYALAALLVVAVAD